MPKYELEANRYFYHVLFKPSLCQRKLNRLYSVLKILKTNILMYTALSFVIRFHNKLSNRISKATKND